MSIVSSGFVNKFARAGKISGPGLGATLARAAPEQAGKSTECRVFVSSTEQAG